MVSLSFPELQQVSISSISLPLCIHFIIKQTEQSFKMCLILNRENNRKAVASKLPVDAEIVGSFQHIISFLKYTLSFASPKVTTFTRLRSLKVCIIIVLVRFVKS